MNLKPSGRLDRRSRRIMRFVARHLVGTLALFAVRIGVAGLTLLVASRLIPGAGTIKVGLIVLLLLSPALLVEATIYGPCCVRAVWRLVSRRAETNPQPTDPPIEQIAADLRRLLWQHDMLMRSADCATRDGARRLRAAEAAITERATQAARALNVPHRPVFGRLDTPQLRRLLRTLTAEGLVLPPAVGLLSPDSSF
jgi:hypothetical protein